MQKIIKGLVCLTFIILIISPYNAFAQEEENEAKITWGAWGRALFSPIVSNDDGDNVPRDDASWGGDSRLGFTIKGESENVGFHIDMKVDGGTLETVQDQQKVWVKPNEVVTIEAGPNVFYDELRGNSEFGGWNWLRYSGMEGEDNIFARGQAGGGDGTRTPNASAGSIVHADTNGLHVFGAVNIIEEGDEIAIGDDTRDADGDGVTDREQYTTALMFQRGQYGIGYELEGLGLVRAQYIGKAYVKDLASDELESYGIINAAFKIDQAIENFYIDFGAFMPTDEDNTNGDNTTLAVYARYTMGNLTPHFLFEAELDKEDAEGDEDTGMKAGLGLDISLSEGYVINTDIRYHNETAVATADVDDQIAFMVGFQQEFDNGKWGVAFQGTTHNFCDDSVIKEDVDDFAWAIPVKLEYSF
jgi:hypothetical protein